MSLTALEYPSFSAATVSVVVSVEYSVIVPHKASRASELPNASWISKRADLPNLINGFEYWPPVTVFSGPSTVTLAIFNVSKWHKESSAV